MAQQIAWEESHLGNFRRIMPPNNQTQLNYYSQFYSQKNQASIYAETAASKKREEVSKRLRLQLEARRRRQHDELRNRKAGIFRFEERGRKRSTLPRRLVERQRLTSLQNQAHWTPGFISSGEERLRLAYMQMRSDLLKDNRILEMVGKQKKNRCIVFFLFFLSACILLCPDIWQSLQGWHLEQQ